MGIKSSKNRSRYQRKAIRLHLGQFIIGVFATSEHLEHEKRQRNIVGKNGRKHIDGKLLPAIDWHDVKDHMAVVKVKCIVL
jgi:hypothetical protein